MAYRLTRRASDDVIDIYLVGGAQFGETAAERYLAGLKQVFEFLSDYPRAARERVEIRPAVRAHPYKSHIVVYRIDDGDVVILGVRHAREDWISEPTA